MAAFLIDGEVTSNRQKKKKRKAERFVWKLINGATRREMRLEAIWQNECIWIGKM